MTKTEISKLIKQAKDQWYVYKLTKQYVKADQLKEKINKLKHVQRYKNN